MSNESKWISVEDKLPDIPKMSSIEVLLWCDDGIAIGVEKGWFKMKLKNYSFEIDDYYFEEADVTHWMPLPKPSKQ